MIVKNEADILSRILSQAKKFADEIIVVDTGSTDKTKEIAKTFTDKVFDFVWVDDFSTARNFSFSHATQDYVMWLDADDTIDEQNINKIIELKNTAKGDVDCYFMKYAVAFNSQNEPTYIYYRERLLKNDKSFFWTDPVHEVITPHGKTQHLDITIMHKKVRPTPSDRNLLIYENQIKKGTTLNARQTFYYARELYYNKKYDDAIAQFKNFLNHPQGWVENKIEACLMLAKCENENKNHWNAIHALLSSYAYDIPRAEIACELANTYILIEKYNIALYWAKLATKLKPNIATGAFVQLESYTIVPNLIICYCYFKLGKNKKAEHYNNKALKFDPNNINAQLNKAYFDSLNPKNDNNKNTNNNIKINKKALTEIINKQNKKIS